MVIIVSSRNGYSRYWKCFHYNQKENVYKTRSNFVEIDHNYKQILSAQPWDNYTADLSMVVEVLTTIRNFIK